MRRGATPTKAKVEAKPPIARKSPKTEDSSGHDLEKQLEEALRGKAEALKLQAEAQEQLQARDRELVEAQEQQTAAAEILRVISSSPTDVQPALGSIPEPASNVAASSAQMTSRRHIRQARWVSTKAYSRRNQYEANHFLAGGSCDTGRRCRLHGPSFSTRRCPRGRADLRYENPRAISRLEIDLRGPRRRRPSQFCRCFGQRCSDQGLPRREALVPRRHNHCRFALSSRLVRGEQQGFWS